MITRDSFTYAHSLVVCPIGGGWDEYIITRTATGWHVSSGDIDYDLVVDAPLAFDALIENLNEAGAFIVDESPVTDTPADVFEYLTDGDIALFPQDSPEYKAMRQMLFGLALEIGNNAVQLVSDDMLTTHIKIARDNALAAIGVLS